jgi:type IV pilus assembly protein PilY1
MDLLPPSGTAKGERVVSAPLLRHGRVIFTTLIPSNDPCKFGGDSWIMELAAGTGGRLDYSAFDLNDDSLFNTSDYVTVTLGGISQTVPVSGVASKVGIIKTPTVISAGEKEYKLASGTTGEIASVKEKGGGAGFGRVSWQELFAQ